ncbi:ABC transporter substrate-binding protein [Microbacterium sp. SLBN-146]|uniref:ABC transporter substrate-binding protein n=1 Tax=Microbacterium sp. SLBN-146 TaxID=2768457 RepID=UPI0011726698|nr:extracellular solute-binding protein [Microbacterium sp. SLBN-146]TQJ30446.1 carbohydrate ABC transporter substrate-binding protein (CUT1 family) [Microbacterium sp. SLBN-146]
MRKIKPIAVVLGAGLAIALAGCSGTSAPAEEGPVDLTMTIWSANENHLALFNEIGEAYVAANPETVSSVTFETLSGDYLTALTTQIAGGDTPDLAWIPEANGKQFVESGVLYPLSPALEAADGYDIGDLIPGAMERWSADDEVFAYPFSNSPFGMYVNRGLVDAAGLEQPSALVDEGEWTWDAAAEIAAAASAQAGDGVGPIMFPQGNRPDVAWDNLSTVWTGWGAQPWSSDGATCEFTSPEMSDALQWYNDAIYEQSAFVKPGETFDFNSGGAVMMTAQLSASGAIDPAMEWDFLPLPDGPAGPSGAVGQAGIGVIAKSEHPEAAADFLAYFTNPENSAKLAQFFPPPRESLLTLETFAQAAPAIKPEDVQRTIIDVVPNAQIKAPHANMSSIAPLVQTAFDALWMPDADVAAVTTDICEQITPLLEG